MAYKGSAPIVRCSELSGTQCTRPVLVGAENCGIPEHVVEKDTLKAARNGTFISSPKPQKPRLTVNEDYDLFEPERSPAADRARPNLEPSSFDASTLCVGTRVQMEFTAHHGTDAKTAIEELRFFAQEALARGSYGRPDSGFHLLQYRRFTVWISPDGKMITGYSTFHYERTPTQVLGGVQSRFGAGRRGGESRVERRVGTTVDYPQRLAFLESLAPDEIHHGTVSSIVNFGLL